MNTLKSSPGLILDLFINVEGPKNRAPVFQYVSQEKDILPPWILSDYSAIKNMVDPLISSPHAHLLNHPSKC